MHQTGECLFITGWKERKEADYEAAERQAKLDIQFYSHKIAVLKAHPVGKRLQKIFLLTCLTTGSNSSQADTFIHSAFFSDKKRCKAKA